MTDMEHAIEQAARVLDKAMQSAEWRWAEDPDDAPNFLARALAEAGLLAPEMRPRQLWRAVSAEGAVWCESSNEAEVRRHARPGDTLQQLWAEVAREQWRAEDDGSADQ